MTAHGFLRRRPVRSTPVVAHAPRVDRCRWYHPDFAPLNKPLAVQACDTLGPYTLPMLCTRTQAGWITVRFGNPLHVTVVGWRYGESGVRE